MEKLKVTELFYSLQGESLYTGTPSIFLRLFGCNFTCSGFGMKRGERSEEHKNVDPKAYNSIDEIPLVHTGCDSFISWDPRFKKFSKDYTVPELIDNIKQFLPNGKFTQDIHFIITGGEPLLGKPRQKLLMNLVHLLKKELGLSHLTFETNGTQLLDEATIDLLNMADIETFFSISAKLPCSGEEWDKAIRPEVIQNYMLVQNSKHAFKFVVADEQDIKDVERAVIQYKESGIDIPVYLMPIGGTEVLYKGNKYKVSDIALKEGYRYSQRLQLDLYGNAWAT